MLELIAHRTPFISDLLSFLLHLPHSILMLRRQNPFLGKEIIDVDRVYRYLIAYVTVFPGIVSVTAGPVQFQVVNDCRSLGHLHLKNGIHLRP